MNTKLVMTVAAWFMGSVGLVLSFLPQEVAALLGKGTTDAIVFQLLGALYFGFAMTNWMAKASLIGGIYGRPIAIGNFAHFLAGAFALLKFSSAHPAQSTMVGLAVVYSGFAIIFGYLLFTHPARSIKTN